MIWKMARPLGLLLAVASIPALIAIPASATNYKVSVTGTVQTVEGNAGGSGIATGDTISGAFLFDDATATGPTLLPIGGGTYSIYSAPFTELSLSIGGYAASYASYAATLTYMDNSFSSDGIVFALDGLPGGPFGSTFANVQFQARGPVSAIDGSGLANDLPYDRLTPSFFASFGNGASSQRVFGSLAISAISAVPEPSTWAMMIAGFGLAGMMVRRGHRVRLRATDGRGLKPRASTARTH